MYGFYIQKKTSERLVIKPIERMVSMVRQLSENPLQKTKQVKERLCLTHCEYILYITHCFAV